MESFIRFLDTRIEAGKKDIARLSAGDYRDDANFAKVRTNIYEVCKTVTEALAHRPGAGLSAVDAQFARFKNTWGAALEKAKEHGDIAAIAVEETKLEALEDVIAHFREVTV